MNNYRVNGEAFIRSGVAHPESITVEKHVQQLFPDSNVNSFRIGHWFTMVLEAEDETEAGELAKKYVDYRHRISPVLYDVNVVSVELLPSS